MTPTSPFRIASALAALFTLAAGSPAVVCGQAPDGPDVGRVIRGPSPPALPAIVARDTEGRVTMRATRLPEGLVLDGQLDELAYQTVPAVSGFVQQEPVEGDPATEKTEVWVFFDERNVYVSARMWDSHPERIVANEMRRDNRGIFLNDSFGVAFDTFYDQRTGFFFQTNALGGLREGLVVNEGNISYDWNTVWDVASGRFEQGWVTEISIPFKSLRWQASPDQVWGVNFRRVVRWKNELSYLSQIPASWGGRGISKFSSAATMVGIQPPSSSRNLELKPYAISDITTDRTVDPVRSNDLGGDFGFDAKYGITKSLTFDFTYNTDFAQVEDDDQQVNLTRFSLFFPEKREFFLEGQGIFEFGGARSGRRGGGGGGGGGFGPPTQTPVLFFSRRIGLQDGDTIPIQAGGRVTGRVGPYLVGLLNIGAESRASADALATNFTVVRVRRDILQRSSIGVIMTNRSKMLEGIGSNQVYGVDGNLSLHQDLEIQGYYARTKTTGRSGDDSSYRAAFNYNADLYALQYEHLKVGVDFNPEIGFLRRDDFRRNYLGGRISRRPASIASIRKVSLSGNVDRIANGSGALESRRQSIDSRIKFAGGDQMNVEYNRDFEWLEEPFEIADDVVLPVGGYGFQNVRATYTLGPQRKITGGASVAYGSFWSGHQSSAGYFGRVELSPQLSIEPRVSINWVDLPEGSFVAKLVSARTTYTISTRMFVGALIQFNSSSDSLTSNIRLRWEYEPGSDLFVVYSEGRDPLGPGRPGLENRGIVVKYTKLFRF